MTCLLSELVRRSDRRPGSNPRAAYAAFAHTYRWWRPVRYQNPAGDFGARTTLLDRSHYAAARQT
jgi:hypothetical protein